MGKIYLEVRSGLGNQLFQFAFGYALSREFKKSLVFCPSFFDHSWKYFLKKVAGREVRIFRLNDILKERFDVVDQQFITKKLGVSLVVLKEDEVEIQEIKSTIIKGNSDIYIQGYWQNPGLFNSFREPITNMIVPSFPLSQRCRQMLDRLDETFVGVHVRRGDFLTNRSFGACSIEYYREGLKRVMSEINNPRIVVFTNDEDWVKREFAHDIPFEIYSNASNKMTDIEELYLMTHFKNLIISNSTYSWWGAYLNKIPDNYVVSPSNWFLKTELQENVGNFNSAGWVLLNNRLELKN